MRKTKAPLALALVVAAPLAIATDTVTYNGTTYRCENSCMVQNGTVRDSQGGSVIKISWANESEGPTDP